MRGAHGRLGHLAHVRRTRVAGHCADAARDAAACGVCHRGCACGVVRARRCQRHAPRRCGGRRVAYAHAAGKRRAGVLACRCVHAVLRGQPGVVPCERLCPAHSRSSRLRPQPHAARPCACLRGARRAYPHGSLFGDGRAAAGIHACDAGEGPYAHARDGDVRAARVAVGPHHGCGHPDGEACGRHGCHRARVCPAWFGQLASRGGRAARRHARAGHRRVCDGGRCRGEPACRPPYCARRRQGDVCHFGGGQVCGEPQGPSRPCLACRGACPCGIRRRDGFRESRVDPLRHLCHGPDRPLCASQP